MRRLSSAVLVAVLLAMWALPARAAIPVQVRDVSLKDFPTVSLTVSVAEAPKNGLPDLAVTENGVSPADLQVAPLSETPDDVDVVLVVDTSGSMQGAPLIAAVAAAERFVDRLPDDIAVGLVAFSDRPAVLARPTTDHGRVLASIRTLGAVGETGLYDAVVTASGLFKGDGQHNIVLLSDGGDTASSASLATATDAARDAGATLFTVGLRSGEFDEAALKRLARKTDGRYSPADTADLSTLYEGLARAIENQFVLTYTSPAAGGQQMTVRVASAGADDTVLLLAPEVEAPPGPAPAAEPEVVDPLLEGDTGLIIAMALTFAGSFLVALLVIAGRARNERSRKLARRLGQDSDPASDDEDAGWIPETLLEVAEKFTGDEHRRSRTDQKLERAGWSLRATEYAAVCMVSGLGGALVAGLLFRNAGMMVLLGAIGTRIPAIVLDISTRRRLEKIQSQLPDILMVLASSLRAGYSFLQALDAVAKEVGGPGAHEFSRVVAEIRLGRSIDDALAEVADRVDSDDLRWAVLAVNIQRDVGGNLAELLDTVATTMRERETIRRQVKVLSAEGRLSMVILSVLPFATGAWIAIVNPEYFGLLFQTKVGLVMVTVGASLLILGVVWMKKLVKIDV